MKTIPLFFIIFLSPFKVFSQSTVSFTVDGKNHTVTGTQIYNHKADKMDDCYLQITKDSLIYHTISWESKNANTTTASTYSEMGMFKKNLAKKVETHKIKEIVEETGVHYVLKIKFTVPAMHQIFYMKGMPPVHDNKKLEIEILFDSKEAATKLYEDYFKE